MISNANVEKKSFRDSLLKEKKSFIILIKVGIFFINLFKIILKYHLVLKILFVRNKNLKKLALFIKYVFCEKVYEHFLKKSIENNIK